MLLNDKSARVTLLVPVNSGAAACCICLPAAFQPWLALPCAARRAEAASLPRPLPCIDHRPPSHAHPATHPTCAALDATIDARPLRNESSLSELITNAPEIINPLVGYHGARCSQ